jgi:DNA-binding transcriptional ArsR family regulator
VGVTGAPTVGGSQDARAETAADAAARALAGRRRRAILRLVAHDELAAGEIAAAFEVTRPAVSQHLTVLKKAGLLPEPREGTRRLYSARPEGLEGLLRFFDDIRISPINTARRLVEDDLVGHGAGSGATLYKQREVELSLAQLVPAPTNIAAEHWGWEKPTGGQLAEVRAVPPGPGV